MGKKQDLTGQRFGRLTVIEECGRANGGVLWKCQCDCGNVTYEAFERWAKDNGYKKGLTLDREDNNGDYEPSNCRWVDMKTQCRNRRNNAVIELNGEKHCLSEWAEMTDQPYARLHSRYRRGWSNKEVIFGRA